MMVANPDSDAGDVTYVALGEDYADIRDGVRRVCADYPAEYWRDKDEESEYPHEFVDAMTQAGLDAEKMEAAVAAEPEKFDAALEENQKAHEAAGHWSVPLMVFEGEPFYGQDRIDLLIWRMRQKGL